MADGAYISFLGIDGIGKTTLARRLIQQLENEGVSVRQVTWRDANDTTESAWPRDALQELWLDTFRLLFGGAAIGSQYVELPRSYDEWARDGWEYRLGELPVSTAHRSGPLAAAMVELAGNLVLTDTIIRPLVSEGHVVLQETFPYKHVLKEILIAREIDSSDALAGLYALAEAFIANVFGSAQMQPDVGVLVEGPAELAHGWRLRESGRLGLLEDFSAAGDRGKESYIRLQDESARHFAKVAAEWGWVRHTVDDGGLEANVARGLGAITAHPTFARILRTQS